MIHESNVWCPDCQKLTGGHCPAHPVKFTTTPTTFYPSITINPVPLVAQGWQCPVCRTVWAPHVQSCGCATHVSVYTTTSTATG